MDSFNRMSESLKQAVPSVQGSSAALAENPLSANMDEVLSAVTQIPGRIHEIKHRISGETGRGFAVA